MEGDLKQIIASPGLVSPEACSALLRRALFLNNLMLKIQKDNCRAVDLIFGPALKQPRISCAVPEKTSC